MFWNSSIQMETPSQIATSVDLYMPFLVEYFGCIVFHLVGSACLPLFAPFANAAILIALVYVSADYSNAQMNPLVSFVFCALGYFDPLHMAYYWVAQVSGCATGALILYGLTPPNEPLGCVSPDRRLTTAQLVGWEAIASFLFLLPTFSVCWNTQHVAGRETGPIIVGISLLSASLMAGQWTGGFVNPARTLGSHIVMLCSNNNSLVWYITGQFWGAFVAFLALVSLYGAYKTPWYRSHIKEVAAIVDSELVGNAI